MYAGGWLEWTSDAQRPSAETGIWGLGPGLRDVTVNGVGRLGVRGCWPHALLAGLPSERPPLALGSLVR